MKEHGEKNLEEIFQRTLWGNFADAKFGFNFQEKKTIFFRGSFEFCVIMQVISRRVHRRLSSSIEGRNYAQKDPGNNQRLF